MPRPRPSADCRPYRMNDQMCCGRCGLQWDMSDPEPPKCEPAVRSAVGPGRRKYVAFIARILKAKS